MISPPTKRGCLDKSAGEHASIGRLVRMVMVQVSSSIRGHLQGTGVSAGEFAMLRVLRGVPACRPSDIADAMGVGLPTVSKITYRLLERSLVIQRPAANDHRCKYLQLAPEGRQMVEELCTDANLAGEQVFGKLTQDERRQLTSLLLKLL